MSYKGSKRYHGPAREKITHTTEDGQDYQIDPDDEVVFVNVNSSPATVTLPDRNDVQNGKVIEIVDVKGKAGTNPITVTTINGTEINGSDQDKEVNANYSRWVFTFHGIDDEWVVVNTSL